MNTVQLTPNQQAIWLEAKLHSNQPIFNIGTYVELNGIPDKDQLEKAIQLVIHENDALRLKIEPTPTEATQTFETNRSFSLNAKHFETTEMARQWMNEDFTQSIEIHDYSLYAISLITAGAHAFLYFKHHHIFIDGWSRAQLVQNISTHYNALLKDEKANTFSCYQSYVEQQIANRNDLSASLQFWQNAFEDFNRVLTFPKKDVAVRHASSKRKRFAMERNAYNEIGAADKTRFYVLLASLYVTLSRSTGNKEIVIGIPLLNRFSEVEKNTIGYFVGLIPLRLSFSLENSFNDIVAGIQSKMKETLPHRNVAIHEINKAIGINFANTTQTFDVVFSFEPHNHDCNFGEYKVIHSGTFSSDFEQNPLVIHVQDFNASDTVNFEFDYNLNYLNEQEVSRLMARFENTVNHFKSNPSDTKAAAPILLDHEKAQLEQFSRGYQAAPARKSLIQQIEEKSQEFPDRIILRDEFTAITYSEMMQQAEKIAGNLIQNGIKPGDSVGIVAPRNVSTVVCVVAILMSGARYVPIDPEIPEERLGYMVAQAEIKAILFDDQNTLPAPISDLIYIDINQLERPKTFKRPEIPFNAPAYIIFTSGTTGKPKGVCINQDSVSNLIQFLKENVYAPYSDHLKLAHIASFHFDQSGQHMFASLILGHELLIVPEMARKDGKLLSEYLTNYSIDVCDGIPTQLRALLSRVPQIPKGFNVKHFIIGGEAFTPDLAQQLFDWGKGQSIQVTNAYGPTESTVFSMHHTFNSTNFGRFSDIPIGRPIRNTNIWIVDENGQLLPPGIQGELCIGGAGLATEYVNQKDLTAAKFRFNEDTQERLYHTGDLAQWNEEGQLFYHGRKDNQVKIKGYRVELSSIESWLNEIKGVEQSVVLIQEKQNQQSVLGFVQSKTIQDEQEVKDALTKHLPSYMIPNQMLFFRDLPLTKTGKFDREKLLNIAANVSPSIQKEPATELEWTLAKIMSKILEVEQIDVEHSFFSQGGDSLSLVYFLAEIEEQLGVSLSMIEFATTNSVRAIAKMIVTQKINAPEAVSLVDELAHFEALPTLKHDDEPNKGETVLLTGATGFVGAFLLRKLLDLYPNIISLVRAENEESAQSRMEDSLKKYSLYSAELQQKIKVLQADLSQERLGLNARDYDLVVDQVDVIYHCGAMVNFMKNFEVLKQVNVGSTYELLKIAHTTKRKQFNYISTMGVFSQRRSTFTENARIQDQEHFKDRGYETTKWIAEGLIEKAREMGIDANVFRLGRITGDHKKGIARSEDFFHRFLEGCAQMKMFPAELLDNHTDLTPVDITTDAIIALAQKSANGVYHILNEKQASYRSMLRNFELQGVDLKIVAYDIWLDHVDALNKTAPSNPLFLITPLLKQKTWFSVYQNVLDNRYTNRLLEAEGIDWPEGNDLWHIYVENCIRQSNKKLSSVTIHNKE
ncbi:MAG: hypothetical protein Crog4KO_22210 [Crocinitomicaceae bacterium]